jgi:hypothetical protein
MMRRRRYSPARLLFLGLLVFGHVALMAHDAHAPAPAAAAAPLATR